VPRPCPSRGLLWKREHFPGSRKQTASSMALGETVVFRKATSILKKGGDSQGESRGRSEKKNTPDRGGEKKIIQPSCKFL